MLSGASVLNYYANAQSGEYSNPVWDTNMADPSVILADDGYFYVYSTGRNINRGRSADLVNWEALPDAFTEQTRPDHVPGASGIWAPDVEFVDGKYLMYYTQTKPMKDGNPNSTIGVAVSMTPDGTFKDCGILFQAKDVGLPGGAVDQFFYRENGQNFLFFGSFRGIYGMKLTSDGLNVEGDPKDMIQIAGDGYEGGMLYKRGKYYYLFASIDKCCAGKNSTYKLVVGRSENLFGPYLNKEGESMTDNRHTLLLEGDGNFIGPGHCSELIEDENGDIWLLYHSYRMDHHTGKVGGRLLMLDRVIFDRQGWPSIQGRCPNIPSMKSVVPAFGKR